MEDVNDSFYEGREIYRIKLTKYGYETGEIMKRYQGYDGRDINDVPMEEKSWNKIGGEYKVDTYGKK